MKPGDAFLLFDEENLGTPPHLHLIIAGPNQQGECVLVSITTRRSKSDTMVCLEVGDHPFIKHPSVITYAYSKVLTVTKLTEMVGSGEATPKEQASDQLLRRAQNGMLETDQAPREIKEAFKELHVR